MSCAAGFFAAADAAVRDFLLSGDPFGGERATERPACSSIGPPTARTPAFARTFAISVPVALSGTPGELLWRAFRDHRSPALTALGTQIDDPVRGLDDVEVVLDHDHGVALVDQPAEDVEKLADVVEVQTRRRLVEHVERVARRPARELGGELDPLRLAAGQGGGGLTETDVAEPDVDEGLQMACDRGLVGEERETLLARHVEDV